MKARLYQICRIVMLIKFIGLIEIIQMKSHIEGLSCL